jgi:hypothetical protein
MISRTIALIVLALLATTSLADARWRVVGHYHGTCRGHPRGSTWVENGFLHKCIGENEPLPAGGHHHRRHHA